MTFKIAEYLTDEAKRAAVAATYTPLDPASSRCPAPRAGAEQYCPLGIALRQMFPRKVVPAAPWPYKVAQLLGNKPGAFEEVAVFTNAWDSGSITDLAAALGVEVQP